MSVTDELLKTTKGKTQYGKHLLGQPDSSIAWRTESTNYGLLRCTYNNSQGNKQIRRVFGIVLSGNYTHWSYNLDKYFNPPDVIARMRNAIEEHPYESQWNYFYLDRGTNGRPIRIHVDELERVFKDLELLE